MNTQEFALTYPQLMNQAIQQKLTEGELFRLRRAYDLTEKLVDGFYRAQSVPFICHLVRTASIVLAEGQPIHVVIAALLHAAYMFGQFEDGICGGRTFRHQSEVRKELGGEVERFISAYHEHLWSKEQVSNEYLPNTENYGEEKKAVITMRLANELEDFLDLGMAYRGTHAAERMESYGHQMISIAEKLGLTVIAKELRSAFTSYKSKQLPSELICRRSRSYEHPERIWQKKTFREKARTIVMKHLGLSKNGHSIPQFDFDSNVMFHELRYLEDDKQLIREVDACIRAHKSLESKVLCCFKSDPEALQKVSPEALKELLSSGKAVHSILTDREISNCIVFNGSAFPEHVFNQEIARLRKKVDEVVSDRMKKLFSRNQELLISNSGHFLYPPGGFMSWHTNANASGWRLYINYVDEPGKSFFRYRDPDTGEVVTLWDKKWNFRLFRIDPKKPFWHAVYSETNRYSFGYRIAIDWDQPLYKRGWARAKYLLHSSLMGNG